MYLRASALASVAFTFALVCAPGSWAGAQDPPAQVQANRGSITGVVRDATSGLPLGIVDVLVVNTNIGARTNDQGQFVITNVPAGIQTLQARRIGYSPATKADIRVAAGAATEVEIRMTQQALVLTGVVTTGLSDPTSGTRAPFSVAQVNAEQLQVPSTGSPLTSLAGKVASMSVRTGAAPGSDVIVQIRNPLSVTGFTQPMVIIDGVIQMQDDPTIAARGINGNPLDVNPENIESIEVVRGAAAAALYGQRAANGVINITTKRGNDLPVGTTRYTLTNELGLSRLGRRVPLASHHRFMVDENNQFIDVFGRPIAGRAFVSDPNQIVDNVWGVPTYDNVDAIFRTGNTLQSHLQVTQSSLSTNFAIAAGASNESGILREPSGGLSRHNLSLNLDHREGNSLQFGIGMYVNRQFDREIATGNSVFTSVLDILPDVNIRARDPETGDYYPFPDGINGNRFNPLYFEPKRDEWEKRIGVQASASGTYRPNSVFSMRAEGGYQRSDRQQQLQWIPRGALTTGGQQDIGQYDIGADLDESFNTQARVGALTGVGGWTIRSFVSLSGQIQKQHGVEVRGDSVFQLGPDIDFTRRQAADQASRDVRTLSYSGSVAINYAEKYIVDLVYRSDGSSLLPPDTRWRDNGRVSLAWAMSEEPWWGMPDITLFKPRYSIGTAGNNPIFSARYETYLQNANTERIFKQNMGNAEIRPEEVTEQEFGVDMSIRDRFGVSLTYVHNTVKNSIRPDTIVSLTGFDTQQKNLGDLAGSTYEATLEAQWMNRRDFRWSSTLVLDRSRQKITSYPRRCAAANTTTRLDRQCEGYVFGEMYAFWHVRDKNDLSPRHIENGTLDQFDINDDGLVVAVGPNGRWTDAKWGQTIVVDDISYAWGLPILAGVYNEDGSRNSDRTKVVGQGLPSFSLGFGNQLQLGRWNLHMQLVGQVGGLIFNRAKMTAYNNEIHPDVDQFGKPDYAKKPITYYASNRSTASGAGGLTGNGTNAREWFMEDADYVKISEMRLAYRLDDRLPLLSKVGVSGGSLAFVARNLYTFTGYSGYDPEVGNNEDLTTARVDAAGYPRYRTYSMQLRLTF